jgi:hypothetical protein
VSLTKDEFQQVVEKLKTPLLSPLTSLQIRNLMSM